MTHVYMVEDNPKSPFYGREVFKAVTVLSAPPVFVCALRAYTLVNGYKRTMTELWTSSPPEHLNRLLKPPSLSDEEVQRKYDDLKSKVEKICEVRVLLCTNPKEAGLPKKKPELIEVKVGGGNVESQLDYAYGLLGKSVSVDEVFKPGQYVDVFGVTKGKGFQGVVKRFGVKILPRKKRKLKRTVGAISPRHPGVMSYVPMPGQMGFHRRPVCNLRILKIGTNGEEVTPKGGFLHFGVIRTSYVMVAGSVPGPAKRLVILRYPIRLPPGVVTEPPKITYVDLSSKQGA